MKRVLRGVIRTKFKLTSRRSADRTIVQALDHYESLTNGLNDEGRKAVRVPPLPGVDSEMREWSIYQILEHNVIVNHSITEIVKSLAAGHYPSHLDKFSPKHDVLPSVAPGPEQAVAHRESIINYRSTVESMPELKGTVLKDHPVFGAFDAHMWHCMFGFHLNLHLRQARSVLKRVRK